MKTAHTPSAPGRRDKPGAAVAEATVQEPTFDLGEFAEEYTPQIVKKSRNVTPKDKKAPKVCRIFNYGGLGPIDFQVWNDKPDNDKAPRHLMVPDVEMEKLTIEQMRQATNLRNAWVVIENDRRKAFNQITGKAFPEIITLTEKLEKAEEVQRELERDAGIKNSALRQRFTDEEIQKDIKEVKARIAAYAGKISVMKAAAIQFEQIKRAVDNSDLRFRDRTLRANAGSSCSPMLKSIMVAGPGKQLRKGRPPRKKYFDGSGRVGISMSPGITVEEAFEGKNGNLRMIHTGRYGRGGERRNKEYILVQLRVSSTEKGRPIFVTIPVVYHRPIPPGCTIGQVYLHRCRTGGRYFWEFSFIVSRPGEKWQYPENVKIAETGTVRVKVGWTQVGEGIQVAEWFGDDGKSGTLMIEARSVHRWLAADKRKSQRDLTFNDMKAKLLAYFDEHADEITVRLKKAMRFLHSAHSAKRIAKIRRAWTWRNPADGRTPNRILGDEAMVMELVEWCDKDFRQWNSETGQRARVIRWRNDEYGCFVSELRSKYHEARVEEVNYAKLARRPAPGETGWINQQARWNARTAAPASLLTMFEERFPKVTVIRLTPEEKAAEKKAAQEERKRLKQAEREAKGEVAKPKKPRKLPKKG